MGVNGKKGIPIFQSRNGKSKSAWKNFKDNKKVYIINDTRDNSTINIDFNNKKIISRMCSPSYTPMAVFKCFVKMAITVMPELEVDDFKETIKWILDKKHSNFYNTNKQLLVRYKMIPGYNVTKYPACFLYKRRVSVCNGPYMFFFINLWLFCLFIRNTYT